MLAKHLSIAILFLATLSLASAFYAPEADSAERAQQFQFQSPTPEQVQKARERLKETSPRGKQEETLAPAEAAPTPVERPLSPFEQYVRGISPLTVSTELRQFGYDLFEQPPSTFAPVEAVPVGPGYLLGPGDELRINLWGKVTAEHTVTIDREGKISLPETGVLHLSGLTFLEGKEFLEREFGRYYKPGEVKSNVGMGRLRTIMVYIVGKAEKPGSYTLSSLSSLINALFAAGGPSKIGSMRDVQVKRQGATIVHFDVYDFLMKGDKSKDIRLMPEDVIFVPANGPLVGIAGNVKAPAIYELEEETRLTSFLEMAGGVTASGYLQRVQVERVFENRAKVTLDVNLEELTEEDNIVLRDGDLVRVFSITQAVTNPIELRGNILRPGTYQWREGIKAKDIIRNSDELLPDAFLDFALVERLVPPDLHKEYLWISLGKLLLEGDEKENLKLKPYDTITIFNKWDLIDREHVRVTGAVNKPGEYEYRPNMKLSDLVKLGGGLKRHAYAGEAEMTRVTPTPAGPKTEKIIVNPEKAIDGDPVYDVELTQDDYLFIRTVPEWELYRVTSITGEVKFPGQYTIKKGETLSSLIERAGGFTDKAYLKGAAFTRESTRNLQQRHIDESIDRLEQQILSSSTAAAEAALTAEAAQQARTVMEQRRALLSKMRAARAQGRIAIRLDVLEKFKGSSSDIACEAGDSLNIPRMPSQVQVIGSIYNPTAFVYDSGASISTYVEKAGGLTRDADKREMYVLKADGTVQSNRQEGGFLGLGGFMSSKLDPGDTIVVPEKLQRIVWLREIKDITTVLYQIAVTAGVLIVTF
ncbi:MAG: SLBB domain-containing protein [Candidatus Eisenbacteria bacterium]|nr:SLBB domain-containing protein [Candidatus Eisenbacteria bacterium]